MKTLWKLLCAVILLGVLNQMAFAKVLEGDDLRANIIKRLPSLNHTKLQVLMQRVGEKPPKNFYNCLCRQDGGGAAPGVGVSYHPDILEPYSEKYSCQHSGSPCMAQGYGCWRFPFPRDSKVWSYCIGKSKYDDNSTIVDVINKKLSVLKKLVPKKPLVSVHTKEMCEAAVASLFITKVTFDHAGWMALCVGLSIGEDITQYGYWYGPGYWGGFEHPTIAGPKAPMDSLDALAQRHDFGYELASRYGKIYGSAVELRLRGIADEIAFRNAMKLSADPNKWLLPPPDIERAKHYRIRMISAFVTESGIYSKASGLTKAIDAVTSPFVTYHDKIDYSNTPNVSSFKKQVSSLINGWKKNEAGKSPEFWVKEREKRVEDQRQQEKRRAFELERNTPFLTKPVK
ncbi:MAG: hypothetical protein DRG30_05290 [Epsilonproteobacteria bacterium]|nr:MAG: hypothetical protein DRG30_05290 [Campylobacterota bacterium]